MLDVVDGRWWRASLSTPSPRFFFTAASGFLASGFKLQGET